MLNQVWRKVDDVHPLLLCPSLRPPLCCPSYFPLFPAFKKKKKELINIRSKVTHHMGVVAGRLQRFMQHLSLPRGSISIYWRRFVSSALHYTPSLQENSVQ